MPPTEPSYWASSRSHRYSLLFALPLLLAYEFLELVAPIRSTGGIIRNGADVILTSLFSAALGPRGPLVFMAVVIAWAIILVRRDRTAGPLRPVRFAVMFVESILLASVFGAVVGLATAQLVGAGRSLAAGGGVSGSPVARLTLSLGAGLYEELLFRVLLVAMLSHVMRTLGISRVPAGVVATLVGAIIFSAFHYLGPLGDPFRVQSFVFRALAGVAFSALYLTRGFGITAWTHALYDVGVLLG